MIAAEEAEKPHPQIATERGVVSALNEAAEVPEE
jgi:hypothetical protein